VWDRLRALRATGTSVIITTHYMDEAERLCDRLVVIDHGRVIREGAPRELVEAEVGHAAVELRIAGDEAARVGAVMGGRQAMAGESLVVFGDDAGVLAAAARAAGVDDMHIAPRLATLEDLFIAATGHALRDDEPG
jgi:lipooligosaccharide transport system ATP-binding protein